MAESKQISPPNESPHWWTHHLWQIKPVQDLFWLALVTGVVWVGFLLRGIFVPILIGFAGAYIVNPVLQWVEQRWNWNRSLLIGLTLTVLIVATTAAGVLLVPQFISETERLAAKAPAYANTVSTRLEQKLDEQWVDDLQDSAAKLPQTGGELLRLILGNAGNALGVVTNVMGTMAYLVATMILIPLYFCYFAWNFQPLVSRMRALIPEANRSEVLRILGRMDSAVGNFIRGRILIVFAMMLMFSIAFLIAGVPYWFLLGCFTGALSFVPYLAFVGCIMAVLVTWVDASTGDGSATWMAVFVSPLLAYCVVQLVEGWLITPWVQSQAMEMNAVTILVVLMIGGSLAGIYGLLLAIPVASCIKILTEEFLVPKLDRSRNECSV